MPIARRHIPNMHKWTNWKDVSSTQPMRQLHDATTDELLGNVFSMQSVPRCYKQDKSRI
jgi:hypothetical protein